MTDHQVTFWRALLAPFPEESLSTKPGRGGKPMTWLDKRALENRLDSVCSPIGWTVEYRPTQRGFIARMGILCPSWREGEWEWIYKEDGAGFEEMDAVDDDEKSGYTNALRRAAQDAWGIGRYLYQKGIPDFLDPNATADRGPASRTPDPAPRPQPQASAPPPAQQPSRFDHGYIPEAGKSVYPWIKEIEKHFHEQLWIGVKKEAEERQFPSVASEWKHDQVQILLSNLIRYLKKLPHYKGEFESVALTAESFSPPTTPTAVQDGAADFKASKARLGRAVKMLVEKQLGKPGGEGDIIAVLTSVSANVPDSAGRTGETLRSLRDCTDQVWVDGMIRYVEDQIRKVVSEKPADGDDDIPF